MNWLDRTVGLFSPRRGLARARYRQALAIAARGYEGAGVGRRTEGWRTPGTGTNSEVAVALPRLRDRSRDLVRNKPTSLYAYHFDLAERNANVRDQPSMCRKANYPNLENAFFYPGTRQAGDHNLHHLWFGGV